MTMMKKILMIIVFFTLFSCLKIGDETKNPNIVIIYLDDLGYGDVSAYKNGLLKTPNIDKLANEGLKFYNEYSSSATCSPSR